MANKTLNDKVIKKGAERFYAARHVEEFVKQLKKEFCYDWVDNIEDCNYIEKCSSCKKIDALVSGGEQNV